jgi:palmitoyltransferase
VQAKLLYQQQLVYQARRQLEEDEEQGLLTDSPAQEQAMRELDWASFKLKSNLLTATADVTELRRQQLVAAGLGSYVDAVEHGRMREICPVCRAHKRLRSHHCSDLGACVDKLDHYCPWIDNAVGQGNHRLFVGFLCAVELATIAYYVLVADVVGSVWSGTSSLHPFSGFAVLLVSSVNLLWLAFVSLLLVRTLVYAAANVTTLEVLVKPAYVIARYPRHRSAPPPRCGVETWFLEGLTLGEAWINLRNFISGVDEEANDLFPPLPGITDRSFVADLKPEQEPLTMSVVSTEPTTPTDVYTHGDNPESM